MDGRRAAFRRSAFCHCRLTLRRDLVSKRCRYSAASAFAGPRPVQLTSPKQVPQRIVLAEKGVGAAGACAAQDALRGTCDVDIVDSVRRHAKRPVIAARTQLSSPEERAARVMLAEKRVGSSKARTSQIALGRARIVDVPNPSADTP